MSVQKVILVEECPEVQLLDIDANTMSEEECLRRLKENIRIVGEGVECVFGKARASDERHARVIDDTLRETKEYMRQNGI